MLCQRGNGQRLAEIQKMHMAVGKAGTDKPTAQIHFRIRRRRVLPAAYIGKPAIFHQKSLLKGKLSRIHGCIIVKRSH